jgi:phenylalanyl-tRNA synthetase beta chain
VLVDGRACGWIGDLHPALQQQLELPQAPVLFEVEVDTLTERAVPQFREVSKFPPVVRDLALVLDESIPAQRLLDEIGASLREIPGGAIVNSVGIFDEYRGKGLENKEKSLAIRLWMQDTQRTLNDAEVADVVASLVERVCHRLGARLR